jgi:hypothetical protein
MDIYGSLAVLGKCERDTAVLRIFGDKRAILFGEQARGINPIRNSDCNGSKEGGFAGPIFTDNQSPLARFIAVLEVEMKSAKTPDIPEMDLCELKAVGERFHRGQS